MSQSQKWQEIHVPGLLHLTKDVLTQDPIREVKQLSEAGLGVGVCNSSYSVG